MLARSTRGRTQEPDDPKQAGGPVGCPGGMSTEEAEETEGKRFISVASCPKGGRYISWYVSVESNMTIAKVFKSGRSQAVRLPKEFRFKGTEVYIDKVGDTVLL